MTGQILLCLVMLVLVCILESFCKVAKFLLILVSYATSVFLTIGQHVRLLLKALITDSPFSYSCPSWQLYSIECLCSPFSGCLVGFNATNEEGSRWSFQHVYLTYVSSSRCTDCLTRSGASSHQSTAAYFFFYSFSSRHPTSHSRLRLLGNA